MAKSAGPVPPALDAWKPAAIAEIQLHLGTFNRWCLCGGKSIDFLLGRQTRPHGDTDIGVFRSDLEDCLQAIGQKRVFLCDPPGHHRAWNGNPVPAHINDIWIADEDLSCWVLQVLVYTDDATHVHFKRNPAIRWKKEAHSIPIKGIQVLNPWITFLYKTHRQVLATKDIQDIQSMIEYFPPLKG